MTIKNLLFDLIYPHYCCSCGQIGEILCASCHNDIISDNQQSGVCVVCQVLTLSDGVCSACESSFSKAWVMGVREDHLSELIDESKYRSRRVGCSAQAALLDELLPELPVDIVVVAVPTIRPHIRARGYGHSELIAKNLARRRNLVYRPLIKRIGSFVQQGSSLSERTRQAKASYRATEAASGKSVLLVDDVYTTGSSVRYAAQALRDVGAKDVWIAVTARQTIDD